MMGNVYETIHLLMYYGRWSFSEAYSLPVQLRNWFTKRLTKTKKDEAEAADPKKKTYL